MLRRLVCLRGYVQAASRNFEECKRADLVEVIVGILYAKPVCIIVQKLFLVLYIIKHYTAYITLVSITIARLSKTKND